ncbi:MAG TPA: 1-acyl-sn-glycerol-3-phosphate acyltransferase [Bdellovibrionota bacterium]|nr:1-acyl-sn-glycerol-3-phosphate acyltransferase [Bdellovibrionota bacterium]
MSIRRLAPAPTFAGRLVYVVRGAFTSGLLMGALLPVNLVQLVGVLLLPISRPAYRKINRACAGFWWGICVWSLEQIYGMRLELEGDTLPYGEDAIVICNHQQMSDIPVLMCLAQSKGRLGDMKWVVKQGLKYVPLIGWGMQMLGCLFVKRAWTEDKESVMGTFAAFHRERLPIWLMSFPEGTRITEKKIERSQRFSVKAGLPIYSHVLVPRTRGFVAAVEGLRTHVGAVYDLTLQFPEGIPTLWQMFEGRVEHARLKVVRYPIDTLPAGRQELERWLLQRFQEKDALLGGYLETHSPGPQPAIN